MARNYNEADLENMLMELIADGDTVIDRGSTWCQTFDDAGILTRDNGLVIILPDGSEFQVTIKRSR